MTDDKQLCLPGLKRVTAGRTKGKPEGSAGGADRGRPRSATTARPKTYVKKRTNTTATMEGLVERLDEALRKVASNKGASGPDKQSIEDVCKNWAVVKPGLKAELLSGKYRPGEIKRVMIPKPGSKEERPLGVPNVIDRVVQEATRQEIEPLFEPGFHPNSHGFRPNKGCHTAIAQAKEYVDEGFELVVDLDISKFFDQVNHQRLMSRLAQQVKDKRILELIGRMLKVKVVMPDGVVVNVEEGLPQGGPLSPLLSNIVLDELDKELAERGHRFVRYADDCNVYVGSQKAGERVMASLKRFIEKRLRLKVNEGKSAVARIEDRQFLGFTLRRMPTDGAIEVLLSRRSKERIDGKVRELTPRGCGRSLDSCIKRLNGYLRGWMGYFAICTERVRRTLNGLDSHIRRRLRAIQLKQWKRKRTIAKKLIKLKVRRKTAWRGVYEGRKGLWALSHSSVVDRGLRNSFFDERGLVSLEGRWSTLNSTMVVPTQLKLSLG